jgi:hypothetical protein
MRKALGALSPAAQRTHLSATGEYSAARLNTVIYLEKVRPQFLSLRHQTRTSAIELSRSSPNPQQTDGFLA